jgi:bifunctional enzyme CysN/CysC
VPAGSELIATDIEAYLDHHAHKDLLRFITCGSVDDGKSTLIGRLLHESQMLFEDQLAALEADSRRVGTRGGEIDYALLLDGLSAEREQGITIDVAYRFFATDRRKFIVADTPGHEQYTRNMVTGASTADLAIILVDARNGVLVQTRRHSYLVSLLGIRHVVLAVNKMDLVGYAKERFDTIEAEYRKFAEGIGIHDITCIPLSAVNGDNVVTVSPETPWYTGPSLIEHLETVSVTDETQDLPFRFPVQWVNRPNLDFRGFSGTVASGMVRVGDRVKALPSGRESTVTRIVTMDGDLEEAVAYQSVTITLADEIDVSRGDVLASTYEAPEVADQFEASVVWMSESPLLMGRNYLMKLGTATLTTAVAPIKHKVNVNTLEQLEASRLELNEIGVCELQLDREIPFDPYEANRQLGSFILIDPVSHNTVGAGLLRTALRRARNVRWQSLEVDKRARASIKGQKPCVLWFEDSTAVSLRAFAGLLEKRLFSLGYHTYLLDTATPGVSTLPAETVVGIAERLNEAGLIVLVAGNAAVPVDSQTTFAAGEFLVVAMDEQPDSEGPDDDEPGTPRSAWVTHDKHHAPDLILTSTTPDAVEQVVSALREHGILAV